MSHVTQARKGYRSVDEDVCLGADNYLGPERWSNEKLGGGNSNIFLFSPLFGEDSHFDYYFSDGLKPPTRKPRVYQLLFWTTGGYANEYFKAETHLINIEVDGGGKYMFFLPYLGRCSKLKSIFFQMGSNHQLL